MSGIWIHSHRVEFSDRVLVFAGAAEWERIEQMDAYREAETKPRWVELWAGTVGAETLSAAADVLIAYLPDSHGREPQPSPVDYVRQRLRGAGVRLSYDWPTVWALPKSEAELEAEAEANEAALRAAEERLAAIAHQMAVEERAKEMRQSRDAKRLVDEETARDRITFPEVRTLADWRTDPPEPKAFRIDQMAHVGGNTNISAIYKGGKSTLTANLTRCLVDGDPFLGEFKVRPLEGNLIYLNFELSESQFYDWLTRCGIRNEHKVIPINLRGMGVYPQHDVSAAWLVEQIKGHDGEGLILDPVQAAFLGSTSSDELVGDFLGRLDRIKAEAGASDLFATTHTGHAVGQDADGVAENERSVGSQRWMGWPDSLWSLTKDRDGLRYLSVTGRETTVDELTLAFDPVTLRLSVGAHVDRREARLGRVQRMVLQFVEENPAASGKACRDGVKAKASDVDNALRELVKTGLVDQAAGPRGAHLHTVSGLGEFVLERS